MAGCTRSRKSPPLNAEPVFALPALVNAHDHGRPVRTGSFGAGGKPLETWLQYQALIPSVDPYLAGVVALSRSALGGVGVVMMHLTRPQGLTDLPSEAAALARAARDVGVRVGFAVSMRDRNPLVYGPSEPILAALPPEARRPIESIIAHPVCGERLHHAGRRGSGGRSRPDCSTSNSAPTACNGAATRCSPRSRRLRSAPAAESTCISWRRGIRGHGRTPLTRGHGQVPRCPWPIVAAADACALRLGTPRRTRIAGRARRHHRREHQLQSASALRHRADGADGRGGMPRCARHRRKRA